MSYTCGISELNLRICGGEEIEKCDVDTDTMDRSTQSREAIYYSVPYERCVQCDGISRNNKWLPYIIKICHNSGTRPM